MKGKPLKSHMRTALMGTPGFAIPTLDYIANAKHENGEPLFDLVAVYTRPPKPTGRGLELSYSPIHQAALELQKTYRLPFKILTPETFKDPKAVEEFVDLKLDILFVGSYSLILKKKMLDSLKMGCLNLHPSLLPKGRGPSPIQYAILQGEKETGLSIMLMTPECDKGPVYLQESTTTEGKTTDDLCIELAQKAPHLIDRVLHEDLEAKEQDESKATYTKKIMPQDAQIDWDQSPEVVSRKIRALSSKPGAFSHIKDKDLKIYNSVILGPENYKTLVDAYNTSADDKKLPSITPGTVLQCTKKIVIACQDGAIELTDVQLQSKNRMSGKDFSNGHFLAVGDKFIKVDIVLPVKKKIMKTDSASQLKKKIAHSSTHKSSNPVYWAAALLNVFRSSSFNKQKDKTPSGRE